MSPRRMGRPGLIGMAARTAVVAGTATAVSGNVQRRQMNRAQDAQAQADAEAQAQQAEAQQAEAQQAEAQQTEYAAQQQAAAPSASAASALLDQLNQLSQLHNAGVLSDTEFTAAKTKLLA
ncbi:SHOCT domain-containing protein [Cryobacterium sp. AP23]